MWKWIKNIFKKSPKVEVKPLPKVNEKPKAPVREYSEFATSPADPNWEYIADHIELDVFNKEQKDNMAWIIRKIEAAKEQYLLPLERATGAPWELTGAWSYREFSLDFSKGLHCGEPWNKKTTLVPKGRGPFNSWLEAAIDALEIKGWVEPNGKRWDFATCLERSERFNGLGYRNKGIYSSYVTAGTNFSEERGKYVADHVFDKNVKDKRPGVAAIMLSLGYERE